MGKMRNEYKILAGKPERRRPLALRRRYWEDNIKMDLRGLWWESMDWMHLAQDRVQSWGGEFLN
jgi:hypothetical protein